METIVHPWKREKELWPIPDSIPEEISGGFPGEQAVKLLMQETINCFATEQEAREAAIGFVNYRRRLLVQEYMGA